MTAIKRDERVWTLTASNRRGTVGAPIVDRGPRIDPYTSVEVLPASQLQGAVKLAEAVEEAIRQFESASKRDLPAVGLGARIHLRAALNEFRGQSGALSSPRQGLTKETE